MTYRELVPQDINTIDELDHSTARDRLIDAVEQEKAQRELEIEKALKKATVLQLLGEIERRDDE